MATSQQLWQVVSPSLSRSLFNTTMPSHSWAQLGSGTWLPQTCLPSLSVAQNGSTEIHGKASRTFHTFATMSQIWSCQLPPAIKPGSPGELLLPAFSGAAGSPSTFLHSLTIPSCGRPSLSCQRDCLPTLKMEKPPKVQPRIFPGLKAVLHPCNLPDAKSTSLTLTLYMCCD